MASVFCKPARSLAMAAIRARLRCSEATSRCAGGFRHRRDDRFVQRLGFGSEILVLAHQLGEPVAAGGEPHRELVHGRCGGGLRAALDRGERLVQRLVLRQQRLLARRKQDRQHHAQLRAVVRERFFRERQRVRSSPGRKEEISEIAGGCRDVRMIRPKRTLADRERAAIQRLGIGIALLVLVEAGKIVERTRDVGMIRSQRLFADRERALDRRFGIGVAAEIAIDLANVVQDRGDRRMLGPGGLLVDRERALKQRLGFGLALLPDIERGQIVEAWPTSGCSRDRPLLPDGQRALEQRLGLGKAALPLIQRGEIGQFGRDPVRFPDRAPSPSMAIERL